MVSVELMLQMKMVLVGPFENRRHALQWISDLVEANPEEKTIIAVNDSHPNRIRVYVGEPGLESDEMRAGF